MIVLLYIYFRILSTCVLGWGDGEMGRWGDGGMEISTTFSTLQYPNTTLLYSP